MFWPRPGASELNSLERFDHRRAIAEAARNNALREIDRHRFSTWLPRCGKWIDEVEEAEFRDVDTGEVERRVVALDH